MVRDLRDGIDARFGCYGGDAQYTLCQPLQCAVLMVQGASARRVYGRERRRIRWLRGRSMASVGEEEFGCW